MLHICRIMRYVYEVYRMKRLSGWLHTQYNGHFPLPTALLLCTNRPLFDLLDLTFCPIFRRRWCQSWRPGTARSRRRNCWARTRCTTGRWRTSYWVSVPSTTHNGPQRPTTIQWPASYQNRPQPPIMGLKSPPQ